MGSERPKQYLAVAGRAVIEHALRRLASHPALSGIVVAIGEGDPYWSQLRLDVPLPLHVVHGGAERCHSVLNALEHLHVRVNAAETDWVVVHDAARPCLRPADLARLIGMLADHPVGGLLAAPITDTVKRADDEGNVVSTVDRQGLWRALTPQMFRVGMLRHALSEAMNRGCVVTDDASAMEMAGYRPRLVEGHPDNIKITRPEDLRLAELFLDEQQHADRAGI